MKKKENNVNIYKSIFNTINNIIFIAIICFDRREQLAHILLRSSCFVVAFTATFLIWLLNLLALQGPILAVYCVRLSHAITCPSKYFQILNIFDQIFKYFALFLKNRTHALTLQNRSFLLFFPFVGVSFIFMTQQFRRALNFASLIFFL